MSKKGVQINAHDTMTTGCYLALAIGLIEKNVQLMNRRKEINWIKSSPYPTPFPMWARRYNVMVSKEKKWGKYWISEWVAAFHKF